MDFLLFYGRIISWLLLTPLLLAGQEPLPDRAARLARQGQVNFEQEAFSAAIPHLDSARQLYLQLVGAGDWEQRVRLFQTMDRLNLSLQRTGDFEGALGVFRRCEPVYQALWEAFPGDSTVAYHVTHLYLGLSWFSLLTGRPDLAVSYCRQALALDPEFQSAYTNLALGHLLEGRFSKAKRIYKKYRNALLSLPFSGEVPMRQIFLDDLDYLESHGISHPDFGRARQMLD